VRIGTTSGAIASLLVPGINFIVYLRLQLDVRLGSLSFVSYICSFMSCLNLTLDFDNSNSAKFLSSTNNIGPFGRFGDLIT
jgi:hypothetical protein